MRTWVLWLAHARLQWRWLVGHDYQPLHSYEYSWYNAFLIMFQKSFAALASSTTPTGRAPRRAPVLSPASASTDTLGRPRVIAIFLVNGQLRRCCALVRAHKFSFYWQLNVDIGNQCSAIAEGNASWATTDSLTVANGTCVSGYAGTPTRSCNADGSFGDIINPCTRTLG